MIICLSVSLLSRGFWIGVLFGQGRHRPTVVCATVSRACAACSQACVRHWCGLLFRAAQKQSLHFEEDSKRLGILSKYDDEEEEALLSVGKDGNLDDDHVRAAIAARLQASAPALTGRAASGTVAADAAAAAAAAAAPPPAAREYLRTGEVGGMELHSSSHPPAHPL